MQHSIQTLSIKNGFILSLTFEDGITGDVDLSSDILGDVGPMFKPLQKPEFFEKAAIDLELGVVSCPNGADLYTGRLYQDVIKSKNIID